jgi:hypothetical protein
MVSGSEDRTIEFYKKRIRSPLTAIRAKCVECMGGHMREVADCTATDCPLYAFRMGKNTLRKKKETPDA